MVPLTHIDGADDTTFAVRFVTSDIIIPRGGHRIADTHASQIARAINQLAAI